MGSLELRPPASRPRLLLLDEDAAFFKSLSRVLEPNIPQLRIDTCLSPNRAQRLLTMSAYHAICSPKLTLGEGTSVLTRGRLAHPPVPFLLTLRPEERKFAQDWLDLGVYDLIFSPLDPAQVLESVKQCGYVV